MIQNLEVFAVIVTYNPDLPSLTGNLQALSEHVSKIVIVNNSNYSLPQFSKSIKVIELGSNQGIAYAQNIGMKWAFAHNASFVLQLDQDSTPDSDMVEKLLECYDNLTQSGYKVGIVAPYFYDKDTLEISMPRFIIERRTHNPSYWIVDYAISSGSLIPKATFETIGQLENRLFIDAVDSEYCWRMKTHGFITVKSRSALLAHKIGIGKITLCRFTSLKLPSPIRHYYQYRNIILLSKRAYVPVYWKVLNFIKLLFRIFVFPLLLHDWKLRIKYMFSGIHDGLFDYYGNINNPIQRKRRMISSSSMSV